MFNLYIYYHDIEILKDKVIPCFKVFVKNTLDIKLIFL